MTHHARYWLLCVSVVSAVGLLSGCAFGKFGKANLTYSSITVPAGLNGQDRASVLKILGVPDATAHVGGNEYWGYSNKSGYFVILFGKTQQKDLVVEFEGNRVGSAYLVDKGSSTGIFAPQGAVAN